MPPQMKHNSDGHPPENALSYALVYAELGFPVFPIWWMQKGVCACYKGKKCESAAKHPIFQAVPHGMKNATLKEGLIRSWWHEYPEAGIAIPTGERSGLDAIDVDSKNGGDMTLAEHIGEHGDLPHDVAMYTTGSGNPRYLFRHINGLRCGLLGPGLELKADNGQIILPPSSHASGGQYCWPFPFTPPTWELPELVPWMLELVRKSRGNGKGFQLPDKIAKGERATTLTRMAGLMRHAGSTPDEILNHLQYVNDSRCDGEVEDERLKSIAKSSKEWPPGTPPQAQQESEPLPPPTTDFPKPPDPAAFYGLLGDIVQEMLPNTESDPVALLTQLLVLIGGNVGDGPHAIAEADKHPGRLFVTIVGRTAKARKGVSMGQARRIMDSLLPSSLGEYGPAEILSGLSTGEGLIAAVRDTVKNAKGDVTDEGVRDKRVIVFESELARLVKVMGREHNILSTTLRQAWDSGDLRVITKTAPLRATGAHICIAAHITKEELLRHLDTTELASGFANRFLWVAVRRSKKLPEGGTLTALSTLTAQTLKNVLKNAHQVKLVTRDPAAKELWASVYPELSEGKPGLLGAVTSRAEAQVLRLSILYCLCDLTNEDDPKASEVMVRPEHLQAALALWDYADRSARWIFGDAVGDPVADTILQALRAQGSLSRNYIREVIFQKHVRAERLDRAFQTLLEAGMVTQREEDTEGRPVTIWSARS